MTIQSTETQKTNQDPNIVSRHLPDGIAGFYSSKTKTIYIDPRLSSGQRRSTIAHELCHAERDDKPTGNEWLDAKQELAVETMAAYRLITFQEILDAAMWCHSLGELAEHLDVDVQILSLRIKLLKPAEMEELVDKCMGWWLP